MKLLAGLGNPGPKYRNNRHNVGFMIADEIARVWNFPNWRSRFQADTAQGRIGSESVLLLKPTTYMNESGRAIGEAARFYDIAPNDIYIIHDELDLAPAKLRLKTGGGHAGNNGIRSIMAHIKGDFHRLRVGVGHPGDKQKVAGHVLKDFSSADKDWLVPMIETMAREIELVLDGDFSTFQNRVHLALPRPAKPEPKDD